MAVVKNKETEPVVALLLSLFILPGLGDMVMGQVHKGAMKLIFVILGFCLCCFPGLIIQIFSLVDTYQTAVAIKTGDMVDENEYMFKPIYSIVKIFDKSALCKS